MRVNTFFNETSIWYFSAHLVMSVEFGESHFLLALECLLLSCFPCFRIRRCATRAKYAVVSGSFPAPSATAVRNPSSATTSPRNLLLWSVCIATKWVWSAATLAPSLLVESLHSKNRLKNVSVTYSIIPECGTSESGTNHIDDTLSNFISEKSEFSYNSEKINFVKKI